MQPVEPWLSGPQKKAPGVIHPGRFLGGKTARRGVLRLAVSPNFIFRRRSRVGIADYFFFFVGFLSKPVIDIGSSNLSSSAASTNFFSSTTWRRVLCSLCAVLATSAALS